jgi:lactoylglutathione lyase
MSPHHLFFLKKHLDFLVGFCMNLAIMANWKPAMNLPSGFIAANTSVPPLGMEVAFVTTSVAEAHTQALVVGATEVKAPESKPWGQVVSYVRCPDGTLVELCSPVNA